MTDIRRYFIPNAAVFITAVCHERLPHLAQPARKELLLGIMREVKGQLPFRMIGYAILDDHFHWLLQPDTSSDLPGIIQSVKLRFARRMKRELEEPGPVEIWQRRYWDHVIRNEDDLQRHLDYIHYNPVKHGLTDAPLNFRWSSFKTYFDRGAYPNDWGIGLPPKSIQGLESE